MRAQRVQNIGDQVVDHRVRRVRGIPDIKAVPLIDVTADIPLDPRIWIRLTTAGVKEHFAVHIHRLLHCMALGLFKAGLQRLHPLDIAVHLGPKRTDCGHHLRVEDNCGPGSFIVQRLGVKAPGRREIGVFAFVNLPPLGGRDQPQYKVARMLIDRLQGIVALLG